MAENRMPLNKGIDTESILEFKESVIKDSSQADRNPTMLGSWTEGDEALVTYGDLEILIGGEGRMNPMQLLLASFIACDIDVISMHASIIGLKIEELSVEATGHFNVQSYIGAAEKPGSGYDNIDYVVRIRAPEITQKQIDYLVERCEKSSPVGDSLSRHIPLNLEFVTK